MKNWTFEEFVAENGGSISSGEGKGFSYAEKPGWGGEEIPYKSYGGVLVGSFEKNPYERGTKIISCGRCMNFFSPLKGTSLIS